MIAQQADDLYGEVRAYGAQLLAQKADVDLHVVVPGVGVEAPDPGEDGLLAHAAALGLHQKAHDVELLGREPDAAACRAQSAAREVQAGVAVGEHFELRALAAEQGVYAGQQLPVVKRLGEVVVRPGVEALDAVLHVGARREHEYGRGHAPGPDAPREAVTVQPRHHYVEQQQVVYARLGILRAAIPVAHDLDLEPAQLQQRLERLRQQGLVLYDKYFHSHHLRTRYTAYLK